MTPPRPFVVALLVLLVLLVGVYVLGLGRGLQRPRARFADLERRFGEARPVRVDELTLAAPGGCVRQLSVNAVVLAANGSCTLVAPRVCPWQRRAFAFSSSAPLLVTVVPAGGPGVKVSGKGEPGIEARFALPSAGATVSLACAMGPCVVTLSRP